MRKAATCTVYSQSCHPVGPLPSVFSRTRQGRCLVRAPTLRVRSSSGGASAQAHALLPSPQDLAAWGNYQDDELGGPPSPSMLRAQHKQQLSVAERQELALRLRRAAHRLPPGMVPPCPLLVRLFRYAVDDLRLFQAIHAAGMEGTIVVVDDPDDADVLLATPRKRTGKEVPLAEAKRLAATRGVPYVALRKLSGERLMRALSPIMGIPVPPHLAPGAGRGAQQPQPLKADTQPAGSAAGAAPTELLGLRGQAQQQQQQQEVPSVLVGLDPARVLAPGSHRLSAGNGGGSGAGSGARGITLSASVAARFGVRAVQDACVRSGGAAAQARLLARPLLQQLEQHVAADLDESDVEDARAALRPQNPSELLGPRYPLMRPVTPGSRVSRKKAAKELAEERAPW